MVLLAVLATLPAAAVPKVYPADSLIVPMDTTYQDHGMLEAYGLVYQLLHDGIPVDWTIEPGKTYGGVDFVASAEDVVTGDPIVDHGYRGGPFVIDAASHDAALPIVQAWQAAHPSVAVHRAVAPFNAEAAREMLVAPSIAVFADGKEEIAFEYLRAAGIPQANGDPWPAKRDKSGEYACPGDKCCPDCLNEDDAAGPTDTIHTDGALFDANGVPRYCQFMSMHYKHPAPVPEVVAEVREFLEYPVHFLAECQAVNAFENAPAGGFLSVGGLEAGNSSDDVDHYHDDDPFAQADGGYENPGGSEPSFSLATGAIYHDDNVVMVSIEDTGPGTDDIWMNGYLDADPDKGKVSYLGGHKYTVDLPISANPSTQGVRYFLNSLFEAPCSAESGSPDPSTWIEGDEGTNDADYTVSACYDNAGPGIAFRSELTLDLPAGVTFVSATGGGVESGGAVTWTLDSVPEGASDCFDVEVTFDAHGAYDFASTFFFFVGLNQESVDSGAPDEVRFGGVNLLRGIDPALDPVLDLEVTAFFTGNPFPHDLSDLQPGSPDLVFYNLDGSSGDTLRVDKSAGKVVVTY
jgi:hypothetical protein